MIYLFSLLFIVFLAFVSVSFLYYKNRKSFIETVDSINASDVYDRPYFVLKDEVGGEMLFSPFYAQNTACAIRQVQELVKNPQLFPKSLKPEDVNLYYVFTLNSKSLFLDGFSFDEEIPVPKKISNCSEDSLKRAYEMHKEIK